MEAAWAESKFLTVLLPSTLQALLNATSSALYSATSMRFDSVAVQLPPSWPSKCLVPENGQQQPRRSIESVPASGLTEPDVSVVRESILAGAQPWTEQHGGCRAHGLRIRLPRQFLDFDGGRAEDSEKLASRGKVKVNDDGAFQSSHNLLFPNIKAGARI